MIMVGLRGTSPDDAKYFFRSLNGLTIGGVILYDQNVTTSPPSSHNILSPEQVKDFNEALQSFSPTPLLIGIDQEGGQVNRLKEKYGFPQSNSWAKLGLLNDIVETQSCATRTASTLSKNGFNLNFAPILDLSLNPDSFIAKKELFLLMLNCSFYPIWHKMWFLSASIFRDKAALVEIPMWELRM